ncbi:hypothetical protein BDQ94DRAFT_58601 [Aspergillus welwitschiae]|uniref:Transmembrane protein n=1 Tax=Aspergillus welwitschiae TaxID=1341132 RepID=A0A3F3PXI4_9EURO|nr:hypothetical protein BDQ94DRAFT_58601 [Aspergillus welwitschiae]RDH31557.1 hypothetical protein BDQ94DRAFT_58601 [Aspergillus welwitschiae]
MRTRAGGKGRGREKGRGGKGKGTRSCRKLQPARSSVELSFQPAALDRVRPAHVMLAKDEVLFCFFLDCLFNKTIFFLSFRIFSFFLFCFWSGFLPIHVTNGFLGNGSFFLGSADESGRNQRSKRVAELVCVGFMRSGR